MPKIDDENSEYEESEYEDTEYENSDYDEEVNKEVTKILKNILNDKSEIVFNIFPNHYEHPEPSDIMEPVQEESEETKKMRKIVEKKRKEVEVYNQSNNPLKLSKSERVLLMDIDNGTKSMILDRIQSKSSGEEGVKMEQWVENFLKIPFNVYKNFEVTPESSNKQIKDFLGKLKENLDKSVFGMDEVKTEIMSFVIKKIMNPDAKGSILALQGPKGTAKCLDPDTLVLKYDGDLEKVKNLLPGDILMGDDSEARIIIDTACGIDKMYTIVPRYGEEYKVNQEHILCLKNKITGCIVEIPVKKYLKKSWVFKKLHHGYHNPVEYNYRGIVSDPYKLGLEYDDHVPDFILLNSIDVRKQFLSGILRIKPYDFKNINVLYHSPNESLERLIWSIGFTVLEKNISSVYFSSKNLLDPIKIEANGLGKYCGFELTGNGRFLFQDHSVSHNTRIARKGIADSLDIPFHSLNFGGLKDSSILVGHDLTYVGSTYGKICQILINSGCMNPIIYMDELDKVGVESSRDIFGVLTHLLDEEQNKEFEDNYFKGIKLDLSKALFIISFNDISQIDSIAADRMRIIKIKPPTKQEKINILKSILIPEINENNENKNLKITINDDMIEYLLSITEEEEGMRKIRENVKKLLERINLCWYSGGTYLPGIYNIMDKTMTNSADVSKKSKKIKLSVTEIVITREIIDKIISKNHLPNNHMHMYI